MKTIKEINYILGDIEGDFIGTDVDEIVTLLEITFGGDNVKFVDERIDNGISDGVYLMLRSYDIKGSDGTIYLRLYYANDDYIITNYVFD